MLDWFQWIKKHKSIVIFIVFIIIVGIPCLIHVLFKIHPTNTFFTAEWTAGDLLGYYGSILAFVGTVILGILALYQNHLIKIEADKHSELLEQREYNKNLPKFMLISRGSNRNLMKLHLELKNISENIANEIEIFLCKIYIQNSEIFWQSDERIKIPALSANTQQDITLNNPEVSSNEYTFLIEMRCNDKYNSMHNYIFKGKCINKEHFPTFSVTEII